MLAFAPFAWAQDVAESMIPTNPIQQAPTLSFHDVKGQTLSLQDFRGKFLVVNLWATWCTPCVKEMPALDHLEAKLGGKDFKVIALNEDHDGLAQTTAFFEKNELKSLGIYVDPSGRAPFLVHAHGLPTTLIIDRKGMEIGRIVGSADWDNPAALIFLRAVMQK
jgi:hypothetical protein